MRFLFVGSRSALTASVWIGSADGFGLVVAARVVGQLGRHGKSVERVGGWLLTRWDCLGRRPGRTARQVLRAVVGWIAWGVFRTGRRSASVASVGTWNREDGRDDGITMSAAERAERSEASEAAESPAAIRTSTIIDTCTEGQRTEERTEDNAASRKFLENIVVGHIRRTCAAKRALFSLRAF